MNEWWNCLNNLTREIGRRGGRGLAERQRRCLIRGNSCSATVTSVCQELGDRSTSKTRKVERAETPEDKGQRRAENRKTVFSRAPRGPVNNASPEVALGALRGSGRCGTRRSDAERLIARNAEIAARNGRPGLEGSRLRFIARPGEKTTLARRSIQFIEARCVEIDFTRRVIMDVTLFLFRREARGKKHPPTSGVYLLLFAAADLHCAIAGRKIDGALSSFQINCLSRFLRPAVYVLGYTLFSVFGCCSLATFLRRCAAFITYESSRY